MTKNTAKITVNSIQSIGNFLYKMDVSIAAHGLVEWLQVKFEYVGANVGHRIDRVDGKHGLIEAHKLFHAYEDELTEQLHEYCTELEGAWAA